MAFIGDALAHTILPGLVAAYLLGLNLLGGAVVAGVATAFGIGWLSRRGTLREDTAIGVTFTGMFALGILLMSTTGSFRDFTHMLFGNVLGIVPRDLVLISVLALVVLGFLFLFHKELELTSFDPTHARAMGLGADKMRYGLLVLLSLTVVAGMQAVGVVLISALLITPAAAASLVTNSLPRMMAISVAIAVFSGVAGLYASYFFDVASGCGHRPRLHHLLRRRLRRAPYSEAVRRRLTGLVRDKAPRLGRRGRYLISPLGTEEAVGSDLRGRSDHRVVVAHLEIPSGRRTRASLHAFTCQPGTGRPIVAVDLEKAAAVVRVDEEEGLGCLPPLPAREILQTGSDKPREESHSWPQNQEQQNAQRGNNGRGALQPDRRSPTRLRGLWRGRRCPPGSGAPLSPRGAAPLRASR